MYLEAAHLAIPEPYAYVDPQQQMKADAGFGTLKNCRWNLAAG
tara:strand:- start:22 stop:150 length:129 start_codon:yes stop_codon:yes gene_type:complete